MTFHMEHPSILGFGNTGAVASNQQVTYSRQCVSLMYPRLHHFTVNANFNVEELIQVKDLLSLPPYVLPPSLEFP